MIFIILHLLRQLPVTQLAALFNDTGSRVRDRYVNSEVLNLTESDGVGGGGGGLLAGVLVYLEADYYNIINDTELTAEMVGALRRSVTTLNCLYV
ncbi:hypothetical protein DPMN_127631 [Dreissena polymorpha]|uniref:Uncharacterized protein n=1 Tax=Dreissena polymorpha TaxID=45954 RepID=A0A9D4H1J5_DREPO|nr:hypothetical protein DPMN_127631 [Dreissena polymorpha]